MLDFNKITTHYSLLSKHCLRAVTLTDESYRGAHSRRIFIHNFSFHALATSFQLYLVQVFHSLSTHTTNVTILIVCVKSSSCCMQTITHEFNESQGAVTATKSMTVSWTGSLHGPCL